MDVEHTTNAIAANAVAIRLLSCVFMFIPPEMRCWYCDSLDMEIFIIMSRDNSYRTGLRFVSQLTTDQADADEHHCPHFGFRHGGDGH